ncbi:S8 family serine peptidase [Archangium sp.]|uniref:S8 family serine peptidase n=1 Tax=Archangium sp. TaxID=1872627 RepID=UPI002ED8A665
MGATAPPKRTVQALGEHRHSPALFEPRWLEVKFQAGAHVRLRGGRPVDLAGKRLVSHRARRLLHLLEAGVWTRSHQLGEDALEELRQEGERHSGAHVPDLNLYFRLRVPPGMAIETVLGELAELEDVEAVHRIPLPAEAPLPPDYSSPSSSSSQAYLNAAPSGIDARAAWSVLGGRGANVRICDVEYSYDHNHADLGSVTWVGPAAVDPMNDPHHGTAVLGILRGLDNGFGVRGIADQAALSFAAANTASGYNVGAAVTHCAHASSPGDIILIEQQLNGPNANPGNPGNGQFGLVAVEWYKPYYDAIVAAVAAGRVVVEVAGNGEQNLDAPIYQTGNNGHYPFLPRNDSGAILVGAGQSPVSGGTPRAPSWFTNYGATVDLQGWGDSVLTAGYGDLYSSEGSPQGYTATFAGTSSAAPIVAGAAASLQGVYRARNGGTPASPALIKKLLQDGATAQQGTGNIGGLPNLARSLTADMRAPPALSVISEAFDSTAGGMTVVRGGSWTVSGGRYVLSSPASGTAEMGNGNLAVHGTSLSGDFTLTTQAKAQGTSGSWDDFSVVFHYTDTSNYYFASFNEGNDSSTHGLFRVQAGRVTQLADFTSVISGGVDYSIKVERLGSMIRVSRNGVLAAEVTDSTFTSGKVGYGTRNDPVSFDNLRVTR